MKISLVLSLFCVISLFCLAGFSTLGLLNSIHKVHSSGQITAIGIGVFTDSNCTLNATSIDWGIIDPGASINKIVYVKNIGNAAETLSMTTSNWNPTVASNYLSVTWNLENARLNPGQTASTTLVLDAQTNLTGFTNFSAEIVIIGSG